MCALFKLLQTAKYKFLLVNKNRTFSVIKLGGNYEEEHIWLQDDNRGTHLKSKSLNNKMKIKLDIKSFFDLDDHARYDMYPMLVQTDSIFYYLKFHVFVRDNSLLLLDYV